MTTTCECMTENPGDGFGERVLTHASTCPEHPEYEAPTYTVMKRSVADHERNGTAGDGRRYGYSLIRVLDAHGHEVAVYDRSRRYGGTAVTVCWILDRTQPGPGRRMGIYSVPKGAPQRTVRAYFIAQVEARFGVKVGR